jgi:stage III sporulation protein AD
MMMKIIGIAFITAITVSILKHTKPEFAFAVGLAGVLVIFVLLLEAIQGVITSFSMMAQTTGMDNQLLKVVLKIVGIGYITEFSAGLLNDFGSASVADKVILGGKITIVALSLPIMENLFRILEGFLQIL